MDQDDGWGREDGRAVFLRLLGAVEAHPGVCRFGLDLAGVHRLDSSFPRESFVALAKRFCGEKSFALRGPLDPDNEDNIDAAARKRQMPLVTRNGSEWRVLGPEPSPGLKPVFEAAMSRGEVTTAELIRTPYEMGSANNVSNKLRQLAEAGYLLRREDASASGGKEYRYLAPC
ncbi:DNA-binding protein [Xanthomonas pisi]|nr:DNA-binding protein [Xanthomonas pisi]